MPASAMFRKCRFRKFLAIVWAECTSFGFAIGGLSYAVEQFAQTGGVGEVDPVPLQHRSHAGDIVSAGAEIVLDGLQTSGRSLEAGGEARVGSGHVGKIARADLRLLSPPCPTEPDLSVANQTKPRRARIVIYTLSLCARL